MQYAGTAEFPSTNNQRIKKKKNHNVAKVAIARQLIELVWHILTKNEEFLYSLPRNTDEKRAKIRQAASAKSGLKFNRKTPSRALYGTNLRGREIKQEIVKRANDEALRITKLLDLGKKLADVSPLRLQSKSTQPQAASFGDHRRRIRQRTRS